MRRARLELHRRVARVVGRRREPERVEAVVPRQLALEVRGRVVHERRSVFSEKLRQRASRLETRLVARLRGGDERGALSEHLPLQLGAEVRLGQHRQAHDRERAQEQRGVLELLHHRDAQRDAGGDVEQGRADQVAKGGAVRGRGRAGRVGGGLGRRGCVVDITGRPNARAARARHAGGRHSGAGDRAHRDARTRGARSGRDRRGRHRLEDTQRHGV